MTNSKELYKEILIDWLQFMGLTVAATAVIVFCTIALIYVGEKIIIG